MDTPHLEKSSTFEKSRYYNGDNKYRLNLDASGGSASATGSGVPVTTASNGDFEEENEDEKSLPQPPTQSYLKMINSKANVTAGNNNDN